MENKIAFQEFIYENSDLFNEISALSSLHTDDDYDEIILKIYEEHYQPRYGIDLNYENEECYIELSK